MTIYLMCTADLQDLLFFRAYTGFEISSDYARTGTYSYKLLVFGSYALFDINPSLTEGYLRVAIYQTGGTLGIILYDSEGGTQLVLSVVLATTLLTLKRGSTIIDSNTFTPSGGFDVYEIYWIINDSTGVCQIKINGSLCIDFSGDTKATSLSNIQSVRFDCNQVGTTLYLDDIVVRDDDWPGQGGVYVLKPNTGSTNENWTASTGNPEDCVDDLPVSYTDYVYTNAITPDTEHLFGIESLPISAPIIKGVGVFCNAKVTAPSNAYIHTMLKVGTTTDLGNNVGIDTSEQWLITYYDVNPDDTAPWEDTDIDALEIGVETA